MWPWKGAEKLGLDQETQVWTITQYTKPTDNDRLSVKNPVGIRIFDTIGLQQEVSKVLLFIGTLVNDHLNEDIRENLSTNGYSSHDCWDDEVLGVGKLGTFLSCQMVNVRDYATSETEMEIEGK